MVEAAIVGVLGAYAVAKLFGFLCGQLFFTILNIYVVVELKLYS